MAEAEGASYTVVFTTLGLLVLLLPLAGLDMFQYESKWLKSCMLSLVIIWMGYDGIAAVVGWDNFVASKQFCLPFKLKAGIPYCLDSISGMVSAQFNLLIFFLAILVNNCRGRLSLKLSVDFEVANSTPGEEGGGVEALGQQLENETPVHVPMQQLGTQD